MSALLLRWEQDGKEAVNVLDVFTASPNRPVDAADVNDAVVDNIIPRLSQNVTYLGCTFQDAQPYSLDSNTDGGLSESAAPINTAFLINKNPVSGRRGRMFIPGVPEGGVGAGGDLTTATQSAMTTAVQGFLDDCAADGLELRILRSDASTAVIDTMTCDGTVGTQRRRMRR